jgi:hypothetical protein
VAFTPIRDDAEDKVKSGTLRVTLGTQAVAIIGALITGLDPLLGDEFSSGQKTAIIVAAIAFVAVAQVADVIARAWTTSAATMRAIPLPKSLDVTVTTGKDEHGRAVGMLMQNGEPQYLVVLKASSSDGSAAWHPARDLKFP